MIEADYNFYNTTYGGSAPEDVEAGRVIVVRPGERVPLDGVVRSGSSVIDASDLYGITPLREVTVGDEVLSEIFKSRMNKRARKNRN